MKILEQTETHAIVHENEPPFYNLYDKRHETEERHLLTKGPMYEWGWCWVASFVGKDHALEVLRECGNET